MKQPISVRAAFAGMVASLALAGWANKALSSPDHTTPRIEISFAELHQPDRFWKRVELIGSSRAMR